MAFVHPFDDADVVAGQGTLGLELLADVPDLAKVVVPVGGGGLASGVAIAIKAARPEVEVVGIQVDAPMSIADGIAVKHVGELTGRLLERWVDDLVLVPEDDIAEAIVLLLEKAKLVVEGAGAVGVAALLGARTRPAAAGSTVVVLSGGNVDAGPAGRGRAAPRDARRAPARGLHARLGPPGLDGAAARPRRRDRRQPRRGPAHARGRRPPRPRDGRAARARDARARPRRARARRPSPRRATRPAPAPDRYSGVT